MEIYKYYFNTKEWEQIRNSNLKRKDRDEAFDAYIKKHGEKVSIKDYFDDCNRDNWRNKDYAYKCFGDAENCIERLAMEETDWDDGLSYCSAKSNHPEDLIESRTDWDEMKSYADGLYYFISQLKREIASGTIITKQ